MQIATFDFHNTIAYCDPWFDLEIRDLPAGVIEMLGSRHGLQSTEDLRAEATRTYRELREQIMASGIELDALASVERVFTELGLPTDTSAITQAIDSLMRDMLSELTPVRGAVEAVIALRSAGTPVGVISSAVYHPFLEWALNEFELLDHLAFVATSASVGYYKSDVRIYQHAYATVDATPDVSVHIGDSPKWDVATAQAAGLGTVLFAENGQPRRTTAEADATPDLVLQSLVGADEPILSLLEARRGDRTNQ